MIIQGNFKINRSVNSTKVRGLKENKYLYKHVQMLIITGQIQLTDTPLLCKAFEDFYSRIISKDLIEQVCFLCQGRSTEDIEKQNNKQISTHYKAGQGKSQDVDQIFSIALRFSFDLIFRETSENNNILQRELAVIVAILIADYEATLQFCK